MRPPPRGFQGIFRTDAEALAAYSEAAGIGRVIPRAVAVPRGPEDVATLVRWALEAGEPLIPRGSGSSMAGGAIGDGVVVDMSRLREIEDPDVSARSVRADVGVLRGELNRRAASAALRFPVDPSSGEFCTIGGMVATNAAGPHSLLHGSIRPWILALECVFDDGTVATVRRGAPPPQTVAVERFLRDAHPFLMADEDEPLRVMKNSSGYAVHIYSRTHELIDLLVGSEGTLVLFTAVELALVPTVAASASLLVSFDDLALAAEAAVVSREHGASACELLDGTFLTLAAKAGRELPVPRNTDAALLVEVEAEDSTKGADVVEHLRVLFGTMGATGAAAAFGPAQEGELWSLRHAASPAITRMDPSLRSMQFIEDAAVPPAKLAEYIMGVRSILARAGTAGVIFGHAGDAHVHVNPLVDVRDNRWRSRVDTILLEVTELVGRLGGTLTGEHGDGRLRTPLLEKVWSAQARSLFVRIKHSFDPANIFNPGVKVPIAGQKAVDVVKYDPLLSPSPPAARRALETVERERAYSRFRLELL